MTTRIALVELVVADMAASLAFYRRLGLAVPEDADGQPHVDVELPGGMRIAWDTVETVRSFDPDWTPPTGGHRMALAFACDDPADVDRTHQELVGAGYGSHKDPWDAFWGMRYAVVLDPDGNTVDLFAPLPASHPSGSPVSARTSRAR
ncbi:MAG TPA: VOC family protein [Streptosporangiales bacterium]